MSVRVANCTVSSTAVSDTRARRHAHSSHAHPEEEVILAIAVGVEQADQEYY